MKFDTRLLDEKKQAMSLFMRLVNTKKLVEVKQYRAGRSLRQNAYLHLLIGYFGQHFGYTLEEAKQIYKEINRGIYVYEKKGRTFWRSSAELDTAEMTQTIDQFREKSKENGCPLPAATDQGWLREIENEIERSKYNR
jgi:N-formylglutamate amidohydrolase